MTAWGGPGRFFPEGRTRRRRGRLLQPAGRVRTIAIVALGTVTLVACSSDGDGTAAKAAKTIVVGSAPFSGSLVVANIYAGALQGEGYQVTVRRSMGQREIYLPALGKGGADNGIDLVPEYVGTLLESVNRNAGEASANLDDSVAKLRARLDGIGLTVLNPAPATDQHAFAVSRATATRLKLSNLSDLAPHAGQLTLGAGAECPGRPTCLSGLEKTYGLKFKVFKVLDTGGVKTMQALTSGEIDVGLVYASDGQVAARDLVVLVDDKKLQIVDNIIPAIRKDIVDGDIRSVLNKVSAALTTADLIQLNKRADIDKADPEVLAREWLLQYGFAKSK